MRAGARSALQLGELAEDIAATDYNLQEVPPAFVLQRCRSQE